MQLAPGIQLAPAPQPSAACLCSYFAPIYRTAMWEVESIPQLSISGVFHAQLDQLLLLNAIPAVHPQRHKVLLQPPHPPQLP